LVLLTEVSGPSSVAFAPVAPQVFAPLQAKSSFSMEPAYGWGRHAPPGASVLVTVRPMMPPFVAVTLRFLAVNSSILSPSDASLTFTPSNWTVGGLIELRSPLAPLPLGQMFSLRATGVDGADASYFIPPTEMVFTTTGEFFSVGSPSGLPDVVYVPRTPMALNLRAPEDVSSWPSGAALSLGMSTSLYGVLGGDEVVFPSTTLAGEVRQGWYSPPLALPASANDTVFFSLSSSALSASTGDLYIPSPYRVALEPYPPNRFGPNLTACACVRGVCDSGWWGTGRCTCPARFAGDNCTACAPGYYGSNCQACACSPYSTCSDGVSGTGFCTCDPNYSGSTCSSFSSSRLLPRNVDVSSVANGVPVLVTFAATMTSPAWSTTVVTLPAVGALFQTSDGVALGAQVAAGLIIPSNAAQRLLYYLPAGPGAGAAPGETLASFTFRVASSSQSNPNNVGVVSLKIARINRAPVIVLHSSVALVEGGSEGSMLAFQNTPLPFQLPSPVSAPAITVQDSDANDGDMMTLSLSTTNGGLLRFAFARDADPALLARITPSPPGLRAPVSLFASSAFTVEAPLALLGTYLSSLVYEPLSIEFVGVDILTIRVNDHGSSGVSSTSLVVDPAGATGTASINIVVQRVNRPPKLEPAANTSVILAGAAKNAALSLSFSVSDPDALDSSVLEMRLSVLHGSLSFSNPLAVGSTAPPRYAEGYSGVGERVIILNATQATMNALLASIVYEPERFYYGEELLSISVDDLGATGLGGRMVGRMDLPFVVAFVDLPPEALGLTVDMPEDFGTTLRLAAVNEDTNASVSLWLLSVPDPRCASLFLWDAARNRRGAWISPSLVPFDLSPFSNASSGAANASSSVTLYAKMTPGSRLLYASSDGCPFAFEGVKESGPVSQVAQVKFALTKLHNHAPQAQRWWSALEHWQAQQVQVEGSVHREEEELLVAQDSLVPLTLRALDVDGDEVSFFVERLPTRGDLFQMVQTADGALNPGTRLTREGAQVSDKAGRLFYRSFPASLLNSSASSPSPGVEPDSPSVRDSFAFRAVDSWGASDEASSAEVVLRVVLASYFAQNDDAAALRQCPNVTVDMSSGQAASVEIDLQSAQRMVLGRGLRVVRVESTPGTGQLLERELVAGSSSGEVMLGASIGAGFVLHASSNLELPLADQPNALKLFYRPPDAAFGLPLAEWTYSCADESGWDSSTSADPVSARGVVSVNVHQVAQAPSVPSTLTFRNVSPLVNTSLSFLPNITDVDSLAPGELHVRVIRLPSFGTLRGSDGEVITADMLPYGNLTEVLLYEPPAGAVMPLYDTFVFVGYDGRLQSRLCEVRLVVGAATMPPIVSHADPSQASLSVFEGGANMATTLSFILTDPKHLGAAITVTLGEEPRVGTLTSLAGVVLHEGATVHASSELSFSLVYVPPVSRGAATKDNFTLYATDALGARSVLPDFMVTLGLDRLQQAPLAAGSSVLATQDVPVLVLFNATSFGDAQDLWVEIRSPLPDNNAQGRLFKCPPGLGQWNNPSTTLEAVTLSASGARISRGCNGDPLALGIVFAPAYLFWTVPAGWPSGVRHALAVQVNFLAHDGALLQSASTATVSIDLTKVNYPPTATPPLGRSTQENEAIIIDLAGTDLDNSDLQAQVQGVPPPEQGVLYQFVLAPSLPSWMSTASGTSFSSAEALLCVGDPIAPLDLVADLSRYGRVVFVPKRWTSGPVTGLSYLVFRVLQPQLFSPSINVAFEVRDVKWGPLFAKDALALANATNGLGSWSSGERVQVSMGQGTVKLIQLSSLVPLFDPDNGTLTFLITSLPAKGTLYQLPLAFDYATDPRVSEAQRDEGVLPADVVGPAITSLSPASNAAVQHGLSYVAFAPAHPDEVGVSSQDYLYSSFAYTVSNGYLRSSTQNVVEMLVEPVYSPPRAPTSAYAPSEPANFTVATRQNEAVIIELPGWVQPEFTDGTYTAYISLAPTGPLNASNGEDLLRRGDLCSFAPVVGSSEASPCGPEYGPRVGAEVKDTARASSLLDGPPRVVFKPFRNSYGPGRDSFAYRIGDSYQGGTLSAPCTVIIDITFVNQPPEAPSSGDGYAVRIDPSLWPAPKGVLLPPASGALAPLRIDLPASDPDNSWEELSFTLLSAPRLGAWWSVTKLPPTVPGGVGTEVRTRLFVNESTGDLSKDAALAAAQLPLLLPSGTLLFHPGGFGGSANPYSSLEYLVRDPSGLSVRGALALNLECSMGTFPNIWRQVSRDDSKGPLCLECPRGASCSSTGAFMPYSQFGWWRSSILDSEGGPIYVPCTLENSCLSTQWARYDGLYPDSSGGLDPVDGSRLNGSSALSDSFGCAPGFAGRLCASCQKGYFKLGAADCAACPSGEDGGASTLYLFLNLMKVAVPLLVVGLGFLYVLKFKLKVDFAFLGIVLRFMQTASSFKSYRLNWPVSQGNTLQALSFINVDFDVLSLECTLPEITFTSKWLAFMLLPLVGAIIILTSVLVVSLLATALEGARAHNRRRKAIAKLRERRGRGEGQPFDDEAMKAPPPVVVAAAGGAEGVPADGAPVPQLPGDVAKPDTALALPDAKSPSPAPAAAAAAGGEEGEQLPPRVDKSLLRVALDKYLSKFWRQGLGLLILGLDFIYLPLCIMSMNMLACTRLDDGTLSLDYSPSLRCDEDWWRSWSQAGILCLVVYGVGIPLLYMMIFFHLRPQVHTYPLRGVPRRCAQWILCPRSLNHRAWKAHSLLDKRERVKLDAAVELANYIALLKWHKMFKQLVEPFHPARFYWQLVVIMRSLAISLCTVFMQNTPLYQAFIVWIVVALALVLHVLYEPYKPHVVYDVNALEGVSLVSLLVILTCGVIFFLSAPSGVGYTGVALTTPYPGFKGMLQAAIYALMGLVFFMGVRLFVRQVKFKLATNAKFQAWLDRSGWRARHARAKKVWSNTDWIRVLKRADPFPTFQWNVPEEQSRVRGLLSPPPRADKAALLPSGSATSAVQTSPSSGGADGALMLAGGGSSTRPSPEPSPTAKDKDKKEQKHVRLDLPPQSTSGTVGAATASGTDGVATPATRASRLTTQITATPSHALSTLPSERDGVALTRAPSLVDDITAIEDAPPPKCAETTMRVVLPPFCPSPSPSGGSAAAQDDNRCIETSVRVFTAPPPSPMAGGGGGGGAGNDVVDRSDNGTPSLLSPSMNGPSSSPTLTGSAGGMDTLGAPLPTAGGHQRMRSTAWRPPRMTVPSPLKDLDAKSLYTHARYVSLGDFSLRQMHLINQGVDLLAGEEEDPEETQGQAMLRLGAAGLTPLGEEDAWHGSSTGAGDGVEGEDAGGWESSSPTNKAPSHAGLAYLRVDTPSNANGGTPVLLSAPSPSPRAGEVSKLDLLSPSLGAGRESPATVLGMGMGTSPSPQNVPGIRVGGYIVADTPALRHVKVMLGRPSYSRWFKPPPPAKLFARRAAAIARQQGALGRLHKLAGKGSAAEGDEDDEYWDSDEYEDDEDEDDDDVGRSPAQKAAAVHNKLNKAKESQAAEGRLAMVMGVLGLRPRPPAPLPLPGQVASSKKKKKKPGTSLKDRPAWGAGAGVQPNGANSNKKASVIATGDATARLAAANAAANMGKTASLKSLITVAGELRRSEAQKASLLKPPPRAPGSSTDRTSVSAGSAAPSPKGPLPRPKPLLPKVATSGSPGATAGAPPAGAGTARKGSSASTPPSRPTTSRGRASVAGPGGVAVAGSPSASPPSRPMGSAFASVASNASAVHRIKAVAQKLTPGAAAAAVAKVGPSLPGSRTNSRPSSRAGSRAGSRPGSPGRMSPFPPQAQVGEGAWESPVARTRAASTPAKMLSRPPVPPPAGMGPRASLSPSPVAPVPLAGMVSLSPHVLSPPPMPMHRGSPRLAALAHSPRLPPSPAPGGPAVATSPAAVPGGALVPPLRPATSTSSPAAGSPLPPPSGSPLSLPRTLMISTRGVSVVSPPPGAAAGGGPSTPGSRPVSSKGSARKMAPAGSPVMAPVGVATPTRSPSVVSGGTPLSASGVGFAAGNAARPRAFSSSPVGTRPMGSISATSSPAAGAARMANASPGLNASPGPNASPSAGPSAPLTAHWLNRPPPLSIQSPPSSAMRSPAANQTPLTASNVLLSSKRTSLPG